MKPSIDNLMAWAVDWVEVPSNQQLLRDRAHASICAFIGAGASLADVGRVTADLSSVAAWRGMTGVVAVLKGQASGWSELVASNQYLYWQVRLVAHLFGVRFYKQFIISIDDAANSLAHAIVAHDLAAARWLGVRLVDSFAGRPFADWPNTPFAPFMAQLYQMWQKKPPLPVPKDTTPGPYQSVIDSWDEGGPRLRDALVRMCEYHVRRTEDENDADVAEFSRPPYVLFPAEVLAVARVRAQLGLVTPEVDHPLMRTPLATLPEVIPHDHDGMIRHVIAKVRAIMPDV